MPDESERFNTERRGFTVQPNFNPGRHGYQWSNPSVGRQGYTYGYVPHGQQGYNYNYWNSPQAYGGRTGLTGIRTFNGQTIGAITPGYLYPYGQAQGVPYQYYPGQGTPGGFASPGRMNPVAAPDPRGSVRMPGGPAPDPNAPASDPTATGADPSRRTIGAPGPVRARANTPTGSPGSTRGGGQFRTSVQGTNLGGEQMDAYNYVQFALNNPDTAAGANINLAQNSLTGEQKQQVAAIAAHASKGPGFLSRMFDYLATGLQCLIGQFTGECGFRDYGRLRAERTAMRSASQVYTELDAAGYGSLASNISGVEPDGRGGFVPVRDQNGAATGLLGRGVERIRNPQMQAFNDAADIGATPSMAQIEGNERIYAEETARLYQDPAVRQRVDAYRQHLQQYPGRNEEVDRFMRDNRQQIEAMADRMINDEQIRNSGRYNYAEHRAEIIQRISTRIRSEHLALFENNAPGNAAPASSNTPTNVIAARMEARARQTGNTTQAVGDTWFEVARERGISDADAEQLRIAIRNNTGADAQTIKTALGRLTLQNQNAVMQFVDNMAPITNNVVTRLQSPTTQPVVVNNPTVTVPTGLPTFAPGSGPVIPT